MNHTARRARLLILFGLLANPALAAADDAARLAERIDALPIRATEYAAIADAVLAAKSPAHAERMLLRVADVDVWGAAQRGDLRALRLVALGDPDRLTMRWPQHGGHDPLGVAMEFDQVEAMRFLLEATNWKPIAPDEVVRQSLFGGNDSRLIRTSLEPEAFSAARRGSLAVLKVAREAGLDLGAHEYDERTFLHVAVENEDDALAAKTLEWLLARGLDPNAADEQGTTPLHEASWRGHRKCVRVLLDGGADPSRRSSWGYSPLNSAIWAGEDEIADLLRKSGGPLDVHVAAGTGDVELLARLWKEPRPTGLERARASEPLAIAAKQGRVEAVRWLLAEDRTPKLDGNHGPLHFACAGGHTAVVDLLLEAGYDIHEVGTANDYWDDGPPLEIAARNGHLDLVRHLLKKGANIEGSAKPKGDEFTATTSPLIAAAGAGHEDVVAFLIEAGANVDPSAEWTAARDRFGDHVTALSAAAEKGHLDVCRLLLERGAKVGGPVRTNSPLHLAAVHGHLDVCELLVEHGADVNHGSELQPKVIGESNGREIKRTEGRGTPLHTAAYGGRPAVVRFLLKAGAKVNVLGGSYERTPLAEALDELDGRRPYDRWDDHVESVRTLVAAGGRVFDSSYGDQIALLGDPDLIATLEARGDELDRSQPKGEKNVGSMLAIAIAIGSKDVVRSLIANGVDPDGEPNRLHRRGTLLDLCGKRGSKLAAIVMLEAGAERTPTAVRAAVSARRVDTLKVLLDRKVPFDGALAAAATAGHEEMVELLVERGAKLDDPEEGTAALLGAVRHGRVAMVEALLHGGADPNARAKGGEFPLRSAMYSEYDTLVDSGDGSGGVTATERIVELLVDAGADPRAETADGWPMPHLAILHENVVAAKAVVARGFPPDPHLAAAFDDVEALKRLLKTSRPAFAESRKSLGQPIEYATRTGAVRSVEFLLKELPELHDAKSVACQRALTRVADRGHREIVELLLDADIPANGDGYSPLLAALTNSHYRGERTEIEIARLLVEHGADVNAGQPGQHHVLHRAIESGDVALVRDLLAAGARPSVPGRDDETPLHLACARSKPEMIAALLEAKAGVGALDKKGRTPLDRVGDAWVNSDEEEKVFDRCVRALLKHGADPTAGLASSVFMAARARHVELVRDLLDAGAPVDSRDQYGTTALMVSLSRYSNGGRDRREKGLAIIELLLARGASTAAVDGQGRSVDFYLDFHHLDDLRERFPRLGRRG